MANLGKIAVGIEVASFFEQTRLTGCENIKCKHISHKGHMCSFKEITIDENGTCKQFGIKEQTKCQE